MLNFIFPSQSVQLETSGLLEGQTVLRVEWRFATAMHGALCVMTFGEQLMQVWPVDNLDLVDQVSSQEVVCFDTNYSDACMQANRPQIQVHTGGGGGGGGGGDCSIPSKTMNSDILCILS